MTAACVCAEVYPAIDRIIDEKGAVPGSLIEILHGVQEEMGYLPQPIQQYIADRLGIPPGTVEGVVTFYSFFTTVPRGRHSIRVCLGTACYVRGGKRVLDAVSKACDCSVGETSPDMRFSVDVVRCVGACGLSPVITIDDDVHDRVKPSKVTELLEDYR